MAPLDRPWRSGAYVSELMRRIEAAGLGRSMGGLMSKNTIAIRMGKMATPMVECISLTMTPEGVDFSFPNLFWATRKADWTATYPPEAVFDAFSRFLERVGWAPKGHPAHAIIRGDPAWRPTPVVEEVGDETRAGPGSRK